MARRLWTAGELEKLRRDRQQAIFDESIVTDRSEVPSEFPALVRADTEGLIERYETQRTS